MSFDTANLVMFFVFVLPVGLFMWMGVAYWGLQTYKMWKNR